MPDMDKNQKAKFAALLKERNKEFQEAEAFSSWLPPVGEHLMMFMKIDRGIAKEKESDENYGFWRLTFKIIAPHDETLDGKTCSIFASNRRKTLGLLKGTVNGINGTPVTDDFTLEQADAVFEENIGQPYNISCTENPKTKFKGLNILARIPQEAAADPETPTDTIPEPAPTPEA